MKRAQLLTMDFILSIAIFVSVLITVISIWHNVDIQIKDLENRRDMQLISIAVSDSLIRSPGNPEDWNETNVQSIGLALEERVLSLDKIYRLMELGYDAAKSRMRLGMLSYQAPEKTHEFYLFFSDKEGYNLTGGIAKSPVAYYSRDPSRTRLLYELNESDLAWDLYWGNTQANLPENPSRYSFGYFSNNVQPEVAFNRMVENQSLYRTILIENLDPVGFDNSDLNISGLQEFVSRGGILLVVGQGPPGANIIDENFSAVGEYNAGNWDEGNASDPWYIMPHTSEGEEVEFEDRRWVFRAGEIDLRIIVSMKDDPDACMVCFWNYDLGRVYYFEDLDGSTEAGLPLINSTVEDAFAIVGEPLKFGLSIWRPSQVVIIKRTVLIDGIDRELASMNLRVWVEKR
ncbi:MAG: hypothetical protein ABIG39_03135 [Candidatus Micrarchaeota archaeon]